MQDRGHTINYKDVKILTIITQSRLRLIRGIIANYEK